MSHFSVLVIGSHVDKQLAPFDESIEVEPYNEVDLERPAEHFMYKTWVLEQKKLPPDCTLEQYFELMQKEWDDGSCDNLRLQDGKLLCSTTCNPESKWDWYVVGGRWTGFFKPKDGIQIVPYGTLALPQLNKIALANSSSDTFGTKTEAGWADVIYKGDVDIEWMRNDAGLKAQEYWRKVHEAIGAHAHITWDAMTEKIASDRANPETFRAALDRARDAYAEQPSVKNMHAAGLIHFANDKADIAASMSEANYIERDRNSALSPYAVLHNGTWYERGRMGWFGMASDEISQEEWDAQFNKMFDELPDDTLLTTVDCHI